MELLVTIYVDKKFVEILFIASRTTLATAASY